MNRTAEQRPLTLAAIKRESDHKHRAETLCDIVAALKIMSGVATPELIADALKDGKIPHCLVVM